MGNFGVDFTCQKKRSKSRSFLGHQKVHLCSVDLGDQKVRLRAVWMGRDLGVKMGSFSGSKIGVEK